MAWDEVPSIDQNGIIIQYDVEYSLPHISDSQMLVSITVGDFSNLEVNITGLQAHTDYSIRVRAHTSIGAGPYSDVVNATTFQNGNWWECIHYICQLILPFAVPTSPPSNITVAALSSTVLRVGWEPLLAISPTSPVTQYEVEVSQDMFDAIPATFNTTVNSETLTTEIAGLEEYVEYSIRVRAYTSAGPGPYSNPVQETTLEDRKHTQCTCSTLTIVLYHSRS